MSQKAPSRPEDSARNPASAGFGLTCSTLPAASTTAAWSGPGSFHDLSGEAEASAAAGPLHAA
jgi:hypothetical protein